ncbi:hypothetical protein Tco_0784999 [Tanacetum coccineum]
MACDDKTLRDDGDNERFAAMEDASTFFDSYNDDDTDYRGSDESLLWNLLFFIVLVISIPRQQHKAAPYTLKIVLQVPPTKLERYLQSVAAVIPLQQQVAKLVAKLGREIQLL